MFRATVKSDEVTFISADAEHPVEIINAAGDDLFRKTAPDVDSGDTELESGAAVVVTDGQYLVSKSSSEIVAREVKAGTFEQATITGKLIVDGELEANGDINHDGAKAGFFGTAPAARPKKKAPAEVSAKEIAEGLETLGLLEH